MFRINLTINHEAKKISVEYYGIFTSVTTPIHLTNRCKKTATGTRSVMFVETIEEAKETADFLVFAHTNTDCQGYEVVRRNKH